MLNLLSPIDAAFLIYFIHTKKEWRLSFNPEARKRIHGANNEFSEVIMYQTLIQNAIQCGELLAIKN